MKNIYLYIVIICSLSFLSCDKESNIPQIKNVTDFTIDTSSSNGSLLGAPESGTEIENATVTITNTELNYNINLSSGNIENIEKIEIVKLFSKDSFSNEVSVSESSTLPFSLTLNSIDQFLDGFNIEKTNLRIGDSFIFKLKVHKKNGDIYYFDNSNNFTLTLNCSANLEGIYSMTNSLASIVELECDLPRLVEITKNPDGTWHIDTADGGFLQFCPYDPSISNPGSFAVECGIVTPLETGGVEFCPDFGIGCINGGSWNQEQGILIFENSDDYFGYGNYTSTYTRQ